MTVTRRPEDVARGLRDAVERLRFGAPVAHVYNPLRYAWEPHRRYLERYASARGGALLLGMNPGPWGMAQTGVPFGDVEMVRDWLGITGKIATPRRQHPRRPVRGFDCPRREVSGRRIWGWARQRFTTPQRFRRRFVVLNYCPLCFLEEGGRNRTPDRLPRDERDTLFEICDRALLETLRILRPRFVVGIGRFAEGRAREVLARVGGPAPGRAPHPSPANPAANRDWAAQMDGALAEAGIPASWFR